MTVCETERTQYKCYPKPEIFDDKMKTNDYVEEHFFGGVFVCWSVGEDTLTNGAMRHNANRIHIDQINP